MTYYIIYLSQMYTIQKEINIETIRNKEQALEKLFVIINEENLSPVSIQNGSLDTINLDDAHFIVIEGEIKNINFLPRFHEE